MIDGVLQSVVMGTLKNQLPRYDGTVTSPGLDAFLTDLTAAAKKHEVPVTDVIAARRVLELKRQNDLYLTNGNIHDEQMGGLAELLEKADWGRRGYSRRVTLTPRQLAACYWVRESGKGRSAPATAHQRRAGGGARCLHRRLSASETKCG
jgi:hypothetical protein